MFCSFNDLMQLPDYLPDPGQPDGTFLEPCVLDLIKQVIIIFVSK